MSLSEEASVSWLGAEEAADAQSDRRLGLLEPLVADLRGGHLRIRSPERPRHSLPRRSRWLAGDARARAVARAAPPRVRRRCRLRGILHRRRLDEPGPRRASPPRRPQRGRRSRGASRKLHRAPLRTASDICCEAIRATEAGATSWLTTTSATPSTRSGSTRRCNILRRLWTAETADLETAQTRKLDRVVEMLELEGGESVLEIGCGWGALALRLAGTKDARVTAITLSPSQLAFARDRAAAQRLDGRIDFRLPDYRDRQRRLRPGRVDRDDRSGRRGATGRPISRRSPGRCERGGRAVLQAITIDETVFDHYRRNPDFIQKHIFPGGFLPTHSTIAVEAARAGLTIVASERSATSYARTLAEWRTALPRPLARCGGARVRRRVFADSGTITSPIARQASRKASSTSA